MWRTEVTSCYVSLANEVWLIWHFKIGSKLAMNAIKPTKLPLCVTYKVLEPPQNAKLRSAKYKMGATVCSEIFFQSWGFLQLEAKNTQLPDDLKQCNRSYISMTNSTCIKTDISKI